MRVGPCFRYQSRFVQGGVVKGLVPSLAEGLAAEIEASPQAETLEILHVNGEQAPAQPFFFRTASWVRLPTGLPCVVQKERPDHWRLAGVPIGTFAWCSACLVSQRWLGMRWPGSRPDSFVYHIV